MRRLALLPLLLHLASCHREEAPRHPELSAIIAAAQQSPALSAAAIGFCLIDDRGAAVFEHQGGTAFIPASTLKTVTTATALEILGPDFHFTTELRSTGSVTAGILEGDVVLVGGGDPMFDLADLQSMASQLKQTGLQRITGGIRIDASLFSGSLYRDFWNWGDIGNGFGSGVCGLNLHHNRYTARFRPGSTLGAPAVFLGTEPEVPGITWKNEVLTGPAGSGDGTMIHGGESTTLIHLRGTIPLDQSEFIVTGAVPDPAAFAVHHFLRALAAQGIQIDGRLSRQNSKAPHLLLQHTSPALIDIITSIHASSDNHETECVFRMLGHQQRRDPSAIIRDHWKARGLEFTALRMEDGCGLARADCITPHDLARLQYLALHGPHGAAYRASLLAEGSLHWKGGAMSGIRSVTGCLTASSGREYTFALIINHFTDPTSASELRQRLIQTVSQL